MKITDNFMIILDALTFVRLLRHNQSDLPEHRMAFRASHGLLAVALTALGRADSEAHDALEREAPSRDCRAGPCPGCCRSSPPSIVIGLISAQLAKIPPDPLLAVFKSLVR